MTKTKKVSSEKKIKYGIQLDPWQKDFLAWEGDKILCTGRQVGKSVICGMDAGEYAVRHPRQTTLIIAPTERQAFALFDKTLRYLSDNYINKICTGKDRPIKSRIKLTNGHIIWCLPTGLSGIGIRFLTIHRLYIDEASRVEDEVFDACTPMLLTTAGDTIMLSTPAGCQGEYYRTWINKDGAYDSFKRFSIESETCIRQREICKTWTEVQRDKALVKIEQERSRKTKAVFMQEYLGRFVDSLLKFFPEKLVKLAMILERPTVTSPYRRMDTYLGVDVAAHGNDETVLFSLARQGDSLLQFDMEITRKTRITDTIRAILHANGRYDYKKIYIDSGGLGVGVSDPLLEHEDTRRKVVEINNASRSIDFDTNQRKRLLKEDLYANLLRLFEQQKIKLFKDPEIYQSLRSVQYENLSGGGIKLFGDYTHITEALIRAAWCMKDKTLNIWCR